MLGGCAESSRQGLAMAWAMPACVIICVTRQVIVTDNQALTGGSNDPNSLTVTAASDALEETVIDK